MELPTLAKLVAIPPVRPISFTICGIQTSDLLVKGYSRLRESRVCTTRKIESHRFWIYIPRHLQNTFIFPCSTSKNVCIRVLKMDPPIKKWKVKITVPGHIEFWCTKCNVKKNFGVFRWRFGRKKVPKNTMSVVFFLILGILCSFLDFFKKGSFKNAMVFFVTLSAPIALLEPSYVLVQWFLLFTF